MKRRILRAIVLATALTVPVLAMPARAQLAVFDGQTYAQNVLEAERALAPGAASDDAKMQSWFAQFHADEAERRRALRRVQIARADIDRAPIGTIHSWCQRVLRDFPLESGAPLGSTVMASCA